MYIYLGEGVFQVYYIADFGSDLFSSGNAIKLDAEVPVSISFKIKRSLFQQHHVLILIKNRSHGKWEEIKPHNGQKIVLAGESNNWQNKGKR